MEVLNILKKLVSYNTVEDKQNKEIIDWIQIFLENNNYICKRVLDTNCNKECLIAQIGENPILGFSGHLDTVGATDAWNSVPFEMKVDKENVYGLGVCDMKGGIAAFLKACSELSKEKLKRGIMLLFTFDEEINFNGIKLLVNEKVKFPEYLILPEPTDLKPVIATKGCLEMKVNFIGKSTHSSTPDKGRNAIIDACSFINKLLDFSEELKQEKNTIFSVPYTTINIGKINGGDAINKVPDLCSIYFDARTINERHNTLIKERINLLLKEYNSNYEVIIDVKANLNNDENMISAIEKICGEKRIAENYVTEASFIKNTKSIILGLGPITAHQANEYIEIDKLNRLVDIYRKIIRNYCY